MRKPKARALGSPKLGRPFLPKGEKRSKKVTLFLTPAEYRALARAAKRQWVAEFARQAVLRSVKFKEGSTKKRKK